MENPFSISFLLENEFRDLGIVVEFIYKRLKSIKYQ